MSDQTDDAKKMTDQAADAFRTGTQTMQSAAQKGAETMKSATTQGAQAMQSAAQQGAQHMQQMGQSAQDMTRRTAEAGMAGMAEFSRMFGEMKWPMMPDVEALMSAHRRNMETLSAANRVALEGAQMVAKRHMEIVQQTMQEMSDTVRALATSDTPQARAVKQADLIKTSYERAVSHLRELADLIQRANGEALQMLNKRFAEAMDEVKALAEKNATRG